MGVPEQLESLDAMSGVGVVENTMRADLSEFATVSRLSNDKDVAEAVGNAAVRRPGNLIRGVRSGLGGPLAIVVALAVAALVATVFIFKPGDDAQSEDMATAAQGSQ